MSDSNFNCIKELLAKKGKKNIDLAKAIEVDPNTVSSWCNNYNQPGYATLFRISDYLEVEARELITLKKDLRKVEPRGRASTGIKKKKFSKKK